MNDFPPRRIDDVIELLTRLAAGDYDARGAPTHTNDDFDAVILGINMLGEELAAHREEVEERVLLRTVELEAARAEAVEASREKSDFLASMSHELRTPMNGVTGLATLLRKTTLDATQRHYVESLQHAGDALLGVINDVLDFSKLEAGRVELEQGDVNPGALLEGVAELIAAEAARKELELVTSCAPDMPGLLVGDEARLRQILLNLASNAVKFTEKGEVVLRAGLRTEDGGRPRIRFEVADTGVGIPRDAQERLFESFTQADASTTRKYGGSGLGLAISRELAVVMGGVIGVDSQEGVGSTFWFEVTLPVSTTAPQPGPDRHVLRDRRVLVVDDNASCRRSLESRLVAWGMHAELTSEPRVVVETMRAAAAAGVPHAVAIIDARMPDLDGLDLAGRIAADPALAATAVLLLSPSGEVEPEGLEATGAAAWLRKPVRSADLAARLVDLLMDPLATGTTESSRAEDAEAGRGAGTVLLVEDDPVNQLVAEGFVTHLGYTVHVVEDGVAAVEAVAAMDYTVVLMDCRMPVMDGYEATTQIRQAEAEGVRVPIIAMTASATEENRQQCAAAGMDDYVTKPIRLDVLSTVLQRWAHA